LKIADTAFRFAVVGIVTAILYYALLLISVEWLGLHPTLASSLCYVIVVVFNYLMHYSWTYNLSADHTTAGVRYLLMIGTGFLVNAMVMHVGVTWMGWNYLLVQTGSVAVIAAWNFVLSTLWVFRN
jgi:putative flippase GtrA